jgi:Protein of unknown function (DUF2815)
MKIKKWNNKNNEVEANVLLEKVKIVYTHIDKPDSEGEFADNKYGCQILIPFESNDSKQLKELFNEMSTNNNKLISVKSKYYPLKKKNIEEIKEKLENEQDENKKKGYEKYLDYTSNNYFMKAASLYEIPVIDLSGNTIDNLDTVIFNEQIVNIQIKFKQPKDKPYFQKFLSGIQLIEVKRKEKGLMFDVVATENQEENDDELPF